MEAFQMDNVKGSIPILAEFNENDFFVYTIDICF